MSTVPEIKQELQPVLCDMCLDNKMVALKTCLKCEISMCAQHLQAHLNTPVLLQTHPLTKPMAPGGLSSGAVRCPEHGKLLEYYCLDDCTCVCVSCSIEDQHRLHNMKTFVSAHKVLVGKLKEEQKELAEWEKQGKALKGWEVKQKQALGVSKESLVKGVLALHDIGLSKVQNSVSGRLAAIQTARQNIEAALSEEDAHLFLQGFAGVHEAVEKARAVDFIHGVEDGAEPRQVVFDLLKNGHQVMEKVRKLQRDLLFLVDPDNQYWGSNKPTNVTFDPQTTGHLALSPDFKMLSCRSPIQSNISQRVYFKSSTADGDLCWTIWFSEEFDWSVGICAKDLPSETSSGNILGGPLYGLEWKDKQFSALHTKTSANQRNQFCLFSKVINYPLKLGSAPQNMDFQNKLEVQWHCSTKSLCFFTRGEYDEVIDLYSVEIDSQLSQPLHPFVTVKNKRQNTSASDCKSSPCFRSHVYEGYGGHSSKSSSCLCHMELVCALDYHGNSSEPSQKKRKVV